jgi:Protein of unknown function (DUF3617)
MKLKLRSVSIAVLPLLGGIAIADEFQLPPVKDGLWESRSKTVGQGKTISDTTIKMCQTNEMTKSQRETSAQLRKQNQCTSKMTQIAPNTYVDETRCAKGPNANETTRIQYTFQGDTGWHMEMHTSHGGTDAVTTMDGKYLGSCPAGMKPGDFITPDGKKYSGG